MSQTLLLDPRDTRLCQGLHWQCLGVKLGYSALSFVASLMLFPAAKTLSSIPFLVLAMLLLLQLRSCCWSPLTALDSGSDCHYQLLLSLPSLEWVIGLPCAIDLDPPSTSAFLPCPAPFVAHPLGEQHISSFHAKEFLPWFTNHSDLIIAIVLYRIHYLFTLRLSL